MENSMNSNGKLEDKVKEVEQIIGKYLPEEKGYQKTVIQAMNYSILAGGKRDIPYVSGNRGSGRAFYGSY